MVLRRALVLVTSLLAASCHRNDDARRAAKQDFERVRAAYEKKKAEQERAKAPPPLTSNAGAKTAPDEAPADSAARAPATVTTPARDTPWIADVAADVGPLSQATASSRGVVVNTRDGELVVTRLGPLPHGAPAKTKLLPAEESSGNFGLGYGPSVTPDHVYWISHGTLVRRSLSTKGAVGPLEVLARDAFDGTRVAVPLSMPGKTLPPIPASVAYVVRPEKDDAPLVAKLWVEGEESQVLTAEGNSTHGVALVHTEDGLLALSVQARMAMTPVHARRVRFPSGHPLLGDDTVVWVGGGIQPLTEMTVLPLPSNIVGFIPHERSTSEFGIARLDIGLTPTMDTPTTWMLYPNGIDPAPVAAGYLCGEPVLLFAEPEAAAPGSEQELVVRALSDASGSHSLRVASGRSFYFASFAEVPGGALAVWVTEGATRAATVRCQKRPK